jgi:hypothetical protein
VISECKLIDVGDCSNNDEAVRVAMGRRPKVPLVPLRSSTGLV